MRTQHNWMALQTPSYDQNKQNNTHNEAENSAPPEPSSTVTACCGHTTKLPSTSTTVNDPWVPVVSSSVPSPSVPDSLLLVSFAAASPHVVPSGSDGWTCSWLKKSSSISWPEEDGAGDWGGFRLMVWWRRWFCLVLDQSGERQQFVTNAGTTEESLIWSWTPQGIVATIMNNSSSRPNVGV